MTTIAVIAMGEMGAGIARRPVERGAHFLQSERGSAAMLSGAARLYEHIAEDNRTGPDTEIIGSLNAFVQTS